MCVLCSSCEHGLDVSPNWWMMDWLSKSLVHWWTMDWLFKISGFLVDDVGVDALVLCLFQKLTFCWFSLRTDFYQKAFPFDFCRLCLSYNLRTALHMKALTVMIVFCCGSDLNFNCASFRGSIQAFHSQNEHSTHTSN